MVQLDAKMKHERYCKGLQRGGKAAVVGGILVHLTLGNLYSFGNLVTYVASYLRNRVDSSVDYSHVVWVLGITIAAQGLFMPLAGLLEKRIGSRLTCLVGSVTMSAGVALTYFSVKYSLICVVLTYGLLVGLGMSVAYVSPLACAMQWYPDRKGFTNGLIVAGFGLGSLGCTTFQTRYLNPDNVTVGPSGYFDSPAVLSRVPSLFLAMATVFLAMQLLGCFLLSRPRQDQVIEPEREELLDDRWDHLLDLPELAANTLGSVSTSSTDFTPRAMLRTPLFYQLWLIYLLNSVAIGYINATYKSFGQTFLRDDYMLAMVGALAAVFNGGGRMFWGRLMDKTSFKTAMCCLTMTLCCLFIALPLTPRVSSPAIAYTANVWLVFFTFCGTFALMPTVAEKAFGAKHYTTNYGLFFTSQVISGLLVPSLNQLLLKNIGYSGCFFTVAGVSATAFIVTCLLPRNL